MSNDLWGRFSLGEIFLLAATILVLALAALVAVGR